MQAIRMCAAIFLGLSFAPGFASLEPPTGQGSYSDLIGLFDEFETWRNPPIGGYQDYGTAAVTERLDELTGLRERMLDMNVRAWTLPQQVDYLAVRSRLDQEWFRYRVSRPWARDPGFYVDRMLRVAFVELPVPQGEREEVRNRLRAIADWVEHAKANLTNVAADYADLALHNLTRADGVGHGHPYRASPPAGVLGWFDDLLGRAQLQPELKPDIEAARDAVRSFLDWLRSNRATMTADAGVGKAHFDWYLRQVKLMPYTSDEVVTLGQRELDRLWSLYALERHRNRALPELVISDSAEEYQARIERTDRHVRAFLEEENILTIPDFIGELDTNAPWIVRPNGPNFWEQVQFRDPHPDHLHAVIPGHRFDRLLAQNVDHPIRSRMFSGARAEGWAVYLEEAMLHAGMFEDLPRVRELIYIFGIFRAARVPADVWLQLNRMSVAQVVDYWLERVPYLDRDVARVDAEIYLRRPPGYGLGYTIGMLQMQHLLAEQRRQQGDAFKLGAFHDEFLGKGWLPIALIRWEMTGLDNEIRAFWDWQPLP
ncbi:MAG: DUF885 family protein [Lysobacterales bacterium]